MKQYRYKYLYDQYSKCMNAMQMESRKNGYFINQSKYCKDFEVSPYVTKAMKTAGIIRTEGGRINRRYYFLVEQINSQRVQDVMEIIKNGKYSNVNNYTNHSSNGNQSRSMDTICAKIFREVHSSEFRKKSNKEGMASIKRCFY